MISGSNRPHLRLRLFMVLVGIGALLIAKDLWLIEHKNSTKSTRPETNTKEIAYRSILKMSETMDESTMPPSLQQFLLRPSKIPGYLEVPDVTFLDGKKHARRDTNAIQAMDICDKYGPKCWGFTFHTKASSAVFQFSFAMPSKARGQVYYIKKEFANFYEKGLATNLKCAVPLQEFENQRTEEGRCQLPYVNVFDKEILRISPPISSLNCTGRIYTAFKNSQLRLLDNVTAESGIDIVYGQPVRRSSDFLSSLDDPETLTLERRKVTFEDTDFVRVEVHFKNGSTQVDYHASVTEKKEVKQRKATGKYPLNIILLMLDGTSSAQFQRMLQKSYTFLKTDLKSHIFKAYSVVGENTNPAMTALLTGRTVQDNWDKYGESRRGMPGAKTVDDWPFLFQEMKQRGFATMYSEDQPQLGAFSFGMMGFDQEPADHYGRTIWNRCSGICISSVPQCVIQFNYLKSFMAAYSGQRKFGVTFLSDLCHKTINMVSGADQQLVRFLGSLKQEGFLNETMLLVMADHGARFGEIRALPQGKVESRLPFLSVTLPHWFEQQNPDFIEALKANTEIITSPFDLHRTFKHLLSFPNLPPGNDSTGGVSLFQRLNPKRTCADAGIPEEYCPCLTWKTIDHTHAHAHKSAKTAVAHINSLLNSTVLSANHCAAPLSLTKVTEAVQKLPKIMALIQMSQEIECHYQVQFQTSPSNALFEALVRVTYTGDFEVMSDVDRVNAYGSQPDCIARELPGLRPYCFCK